LAVNAKVATVLGSIPASSNTVETWEGADEAVLSNVHKKDYYIAGPSKPLTETVQKYACGGKIRYGTNPRTNKTDPQRVTVKSVGKPFI
jgi:hypothetical protein